MHWQYLKLPCLPCTGAFIFKQLILQSKKNKITMGRGDKKTAKGKRFQGSFGKTRPAKKKTANKKAGSEKKA
jgi:30S ribosomal protein S31